MAKEQDELVKLSQTNEENRGCQMHGLAYLLSFVYRRRPKLVRNFAHVLTAVLRLCGDACGG